MATKKRDGVDALKSTTGGKRRDDRQVIGKTYFDPITIDAKNALTVIYLLKSPEDNVMLRAVASLEVFGRKDPENFKLLCTLGIFEYIYPLVNHSDNVVKRFTLKLLGMLCGFEEFRDQMLGVKNVLETFADILRKHEADAVLQEFSSLILAELSKDYQAALSLLKVDRCIETLFEKINSVDPDIQKNCLEIMSHLLSVVNGVEAFTESPGFDIKLLLNLTSSSYPAIQALVLQILKQLTSMCRNTRPLLDFRDGKGVEIILAILEREEWSDLHDGALDLLLNVSECPDLCDYLQTSGCLSHVIGLLDTTTNIIHLRKILGILARMSQTRTGGMALILVEMDDRFVDYLSLEDEDEVIEMQACLGIANLAHHTQAARRIMDRNPVVRLTELITDNANTDLGNLAAFALSSLAKVDRRVAETLLQNDEYKELLTVLTDCPGLPTEICQNVIQVFIGVAQFGNLKNNMISEDLIAALLKCLPQHKNAGRDAILQAEALECLAEYLTDYDARVLFNSLNGIEPLLNCLRSKYAFVREWAGHVTLVVSQSVDFIKTFIRKNGINWMLKERNTMYAMPSWQSAIEAIFSTFLPAKFAYTGRLDFQDVTQDAFYVYSNPRHKFIILEELLQNKISPIVPVYIANFGSTLNFPESKEDSTLGSKVSVDSYPESQVPTKERLSPQIQDSRDAPEGQDGEDSQEGQDESNSSHTLEMQYSSWEQNIFINLEKCLPDPYLQDYLENLRKMLAKDDSSIGDVCWNYLHPDLVRRRVKILAQFIANEMSGPESGLSSNSLYKEAHLRAMRYHFGTNIIPLGAIRMGSYLERAILFKVLADRVQMPCALVRGPYGRTWVEISLPVINIEDAEDSGDLARATTPGSFEGSRIITESETNESGTNRTRRSTMSGESALYNTDDRYWFQRIKTEDFKSFPGEFLKPNVIVDLIHQPGRLIEINSIEADEYRGSFLRCKLNDQVDLALP